MKIPLHRPSPHGQAGTGRLAVTVAHGIQDAIQMIEQAIDGVGRARRLRAIIGRSEVRTVATQLADHLRHRAVKRGSGPLGQAPEALRKLTFGRRLIHTPGPIQHLAAQGITAPLFDLEDRVQVAEHQGELGKEPAPGFARRFEPVRANRTRLVIGKDL